MRSQTGVWERETKSESDIQVKANNGLWEPLKIQSERNILCLFNNVQYNMLWSKSIFRGCLMIVQQRYLCTSWCPSSRSSEITEIRTPYWLEYHNHSEQSRSFADMRSQTGVWERETKSESDIQVKAKRKLIADHN